MLGIAREATLTSFRTVSFSQQQPTVSPTRSFNLHGLYLFSPADEGALSYICMCLSERSRVLMVAVAATYRLKMGSLDVGYRWVHDQTHLSRGRDHVIAPEREIRGKKRKSRVGNKMVLYYTRIVSYPDARLKSFKSQLCRQRVFYG